MSKTTNKCSPEVRERAVRMVLDNEGQHESLWAAILSISSKFGCAAQTLNEWVKRAEVDRGSRAGVPTEMAERMKALEGENWELAWCRPWNKHVASGLIATSDESKTEERREHAQSLPH